MKILGVIPARGGSKRIPFKNLYHLNGKPLVDYTIEAAMESKNLADVLLTTDELNIGERVKNRFRWIRQPSELSTDEVPMLPVITNAVREYGQPIDAVMTLQPTSPFRTGQDIDMAIACYWRAHMRDGARCLVSVSPGIHPVKNYDVDGRPFLEQIPYSKWKHRCYTRNGAIFITDLSLLAEGKLFDHRPYLFHMPKIRSIDIDEMDDMQMAEALLKGGYVA